MKRASSRLASAGLPGSDRTTGAKLRSVADAFVILQQNRHEADYNNYNNFKRCTRSDALSLAGVVARAFADWRSVRREPAAQDYLFSLLIRER